MRMTLLTVLTAIVILVFGSGCAQVMAYRQPAPVDRDLLIAGTDRGSVIGALGPPVVTEESDESLSDTYSFTDGGMVNSTAGKAIRILLYTAGDVFTLFLDQVLWIPAELLMDGTKYSATVDYERNESHRWTAQRMVEQEIDGDSEMIVVFEEAPDSSIAVAEPPAAEFAPDSEFAIE